MHLYMCIYIYICHGWEPDLASADADPKRIKTPCSLNGAIQRPQRAVLHETITQSIWIKHECAYFWLYISTKLLFWISDCSHQKKVHRIHICMSLSSQAFTVEPRLVSPICNVFHLESGCLIDTYIFIYIGIPVYIIIYIYIHLQNCLHLYMGLVLLQATAVKSAQASRLQNLKDVWKRCKGENDRKDQWSLKENCNSNSNRMLQTPSVSIFLHACIQLYTYIRLYMTYTCKYTSAYTYMHGSFFLAWSWCSSIFNGT